MSYRYQARITNQLRRLGGSYDWDRTAFTMDEVPFVDQFNYVTSFDDRKRSASRVPSSRPSAGYTRTVCIYRANRLVNWCVKLNTTLSNLEVLALLS
jgi:valyl-tRNA synthetase